MLLDRRRVKFWQKWIFGIMAVLMAGFLLMIPISRASGCSGTTSSVSNALKSDITKYETAVKTDPTSVNAWQSLGDDYVSEVTAQRGQSTSLTASEKATLDKAAQAYRKVTALLAAQKDPAAKAQRLTVLQDLAAVYDSMGQYQKETTVYGELTGLKPNNADYFFAMGNVAIKAGDTTNALLAFQRFVALAPSDPLTPQVKAWIKQNAPKPTPAPTNTKGTGQ